MKFCCDSPWTAAIRVGSTGLAIVLSGLTASCGADDDFDRTIAPIFASHCLDCHSGEEPQGGLDLSRRESFAQGGDSGAAITAGDATDSLLWERIASDEMPPKHPLDADQKQLIRQWITSGARWGTSPIDPFAVTTATRAGYDWWSLQPLRAPEPPDHPDSDWPRNDIDRFVFAKLQTAGLTPAPVASPRALVRRLYFDLIGLPPAPDLVASFAADPSAAAYEQLVDNLLASEHYGERWGRHWLDVVRFGESSGFERNKPRPTAWYYRDWVINALNDDMPYDDFVRHQLIGDQLLGGIDGAAATGFWVAGVHNTVVGGSERMKLIARQDELEDVLGTVGQTFLGLTVNCARCHDHKFDPISQKEYYQIASAISGLGFGERQVESPAAAAELDRIKTRLTAIAEQRAAIDRVARREIVASRADSPQEPVEGPQPLARWEFDVDFRDSLGTLHGTPDGNAVIKDGALVVDGTSFVATTPVTNDITEKTLEAWVQLDDPNQRGGGVISLETINGGVFDAIVFAERESHRWMPGSNGFTRTDSFQGPPDNEAAQQIVHVAIVYEKDGTITGYRNGLQYGQPVRKAPLQPYTAGQAEVVFGLRHRPAGGNRMLKAHIHQAALYDRALTPQEVAASAGNSASYVTEEQITAWLSEDQREQRRQLTAQIDDLMAQRDRQAGLARRKIYTLNPKNGSVAHVLRRGDPMNIGEQVAPAAIAAVSGVSADFELAADAAESDRRQRLAEWITSVHNPLFARVIANRIWHYHFGTGLVDTPSDFGFNGGRPSHPELLDWLALQLRDGEFRLKSFHRLLVTSGTYQQSGFPDHRQSAQALSVDADNRLLWHMTPRRLEAESLRDAMLTVAGQLNPQRGGPGFVDVSIVENNGTTYYSPIDVDGPEYFRRTVYRFNPRGGRSSLLDTFDCPDPANTAPRRAVTTTPLQALSLLNNSFVLRMADAFAERVEREAGDAVPQQVQRAWQLAVLRQPAPEEQRLSVDLVTQHGLPALCRGLFNTTEFVLIE